MVAARVVAATALMVAASNAYAAPCPPGENLVDTDGDAMFDYACVGDWDNSGSCEMEEDIRAAIQRLDDPGQKIVELDACEFSPPITAQGYWAIIELPSNTTIFGDRVGTVLNGFASTDVTSQQAVIANEDHVAGNTNIVVRDLTINGGWQDGDATGFFHNRMGVYFARCDGCRAERLTVTDTLHACLYAKNSDGIEFLDSTLERCGNYTGQGNTFNCVYLYASPDNRLTNVLVSGNDCDGSGSSSYNTRRQAESSTLTNLVFENNIGRNTGPYNDGGPKRCIIVSGVDGARFINNTCFNTGGFSSIYSSAYYSEGGDQSASRNILIDGLDLYGSWFDRAPIVIEWHAENFVLRNILVHGAESSCVWVRPPVRDIVFEHNTLLDCYASGIKTIPTMGETPPVQDLTIDSNTIDGVGGDGIQLVLDAAAESMNVSITGNSILDFGITQAGSDVYGIELLGNVANGVISGNILEDVDWQASGGVHQDLPTNNPDLLCTNTCQGTLDYESCLYVENDPSYSHDWDLNGSVDACDDDDGDGVLDTQDNCPADPNPSQGDFDQDLEGDRCDTNDGLIYVVPDNYARMAWQNESGFSTWNVYRGSLDTLMSQGIYTQLPGSNSVADRVCDVTDRWYDDLNAPPTIKPAFYLVTGNSGGAESSLGNDSSGVERSSDNPCTTPGS